MVCVLLSYIIDTKIVNNKAELEGAVDVFPKIGSTGGPHNICGEAVSPSNIYLIACLLEVSHKCFSLFPNR